MERQHSLLLVEDEQVLRGLVAEFNEDLAIFELAAEELDSLLEQQRRRADLAERRAAETMHGRERLQHARAEAARELSARIAGRTLTPTVAHFLDRHWQHHLGHLSGNTDLPDWQTPQYRPWRLQERRELNPGSVGGAVAPTGMVQARISFGPEVK